MLNWKVVTPSVASFSAIMFVLCVADGLVAPDRFHASWLLEAVLPGFGWLTVWSFVLGLIETAFYGAAAGLLYTTLYNYFGRRVDRAASRRVTAARAA